MVTARAAAADRVNRLKSPRAAPTHRNVPSHGGNRAQRSLTLLALTLFAVGGLQLMALSRVSMPSRPLPLPIFAVAALFLFAELGRMHIEVRRSAITVTLSDAAMIIALFTMQPAHAVLARVIVCYPVLVWLYRRSLMRLAINAGMMIFESVVCASVLALLGSGSPTSPRSWLFTMLAVQVSGLLAGLMVNLAIRLNGDTETLKDIVGGLLMGAAVSASTCVLGVACITVTAGAPDGRWLLLAAILVGLSIYRGYARLHERKAALEAVHGFSRSLETDEGAHALLGTVLNAVPPLVGAARAEIVLRAEDGGRHRRVVLADGEVRVEEAADLDWPVQKVLDTSQPLTLGRHSRHHSVRELLRSADLRELMVAPLPTDRGASGALLAIDRLGQVRGFRRADLILFETLAMHAGIALQNVQLVDKLRYDVEHDRLTGLLNRQGLSNAIGQHSAGGVVLIHLSGLSEVNDALGHAAGDALLKAVAAALQAGVRDGTPVARIDNDVFAVLLTSSRQQYAEMLADRLLAIVTEPIDIDDVPVSIGATVGIAVGEHHDDLVRRAEIALRAAHGRDGGFLVFEPGMEPPSAHRLSIAAELRQVLADPALRRDVVTYYQPKADLKTGRVHAVEALVRWRHRERGLVPPADFVPVVESTGLVRPLTLHVIDTALRDAVRWQADGSPFSVAVNLSARSLRDPQLVEDVTALLRKHGADPELLTLEITESVVMDDPDRARDILEQLAALGISLSVDDFGTGYSSLAYLARLPVHEVKVDRAFVSRMTRDPRDAAVVRSVVELGHSLGLRVVAEGVEERDCWDALVGLGVDVVQGFLLARPMPVEQLEPWLARHEADRATAPTPVAGA